jgi:hypothetical protein
VFPDPGNLRPVIDANSCIGKMLFEHTISGVENLEPSRLTSPSIAGGDGFGKRARGEGAASSGQNLKPSVVAFGDLKV